MKNILVVGLVIFLSACATTTSIPINEVYKLNRLKEPVGEFANDGIFQDFSHDNGNLASIWLDTDAKSHGGSDLAAVKPWVVRDDGDSPYFRIHYSRQGYGINLKIGPKERTPEVINEGSILAITMRSHDKACVGVRIQEQDGEVWFYGKAELKYQRLCTDDNGEWQTFTVPLTDKGWVRFPYNGNIVFGNNEREYDSLISLSLELGLDGTYYFASGETSLDIREITVKNP